MVKNILIIFFSFISFIAFSQKASEDIYYPDESKDVSGNLKGENHEDLLKRANELFNLNDFLEAERIYESIIRKSPYNEFAYFGRANCREQLGNIEGALADYRIVHHLDPEMREAFFNSAVLEYDLGDFNAAIPLFEKLLSMPHGSTQAIYFQGVQYSPHTTPVLTGVSSMANQQEVIVYHYLGKCYEGLKDYDKAELNYTKAISINPSAEIHLNRGIMRNKFNFNKAAVEDFEQALMLEPENSLVLYWLSVVAQETGDDSLTIAALDKVIDGDNAFPEAFVHRGFIKYKSGNFKEAIEDYDRAIELTSQMPEAFVKRGLAKDKLLEYNGAIKDFTSALKIDKHNAMTFQYRGNTYFKMGKFEAALNDYNVSIKLDQSNPNLYYNRALARNNIMQNEGSEKVCMDLHKAIELGMETASKTLKGLCP